MFKDEPSDFHDALRWHRGLIAFYEMNLLRPLVGGNPTLCEGHRIELRAHQERLASLEADLPVPPVASGREFASAG